MRYTHMWIYQTESRYKNIKSMITSLTQLQLTLRSFIFSSIHIVKKCVSKKRIQLSALLFDMHGVYNVLIIESNIKLFLTVKFPAYNLFLSRSSGYNYILRFHGFKFPFLT
jgi:hypothetical protein